MIDPLTVVIAHLEDDDDLVGLVAGQIASKHKFALPQASRSWAVVPGTGALQIRYAPGGAPNLDSAVQTVRLEARCYGVSEDEAAAVWRALVTVSRATNRASITTTDGTGLLYWLVQEGSPQFEIDPDVRINMVLAYMRAQVHEDSLT